MQTIEASKSRNLKQHNIITYAKYRFSVVEKRIIYLIIEKLNGLDNEAIIQATNGDSLRLTINYRPILELTELWSDNVSKNHSYIKDAVKSLRGRSYDFENVKAEFEGQEVYVDEGFSLVSQYKIIKGSTIVKIDVPSLAVKYFSYFKGGNFTNYNMFNAMTLESRYSQRMYEMCSRWKDTKYFSRTVEQLKEALEIPDSHNISTIKKEVLDLAKKELYQYTELSFSYRERKEGKRIVAFEFTVFFNAKKDKELRAELPEDTIILIMTQK